MTKFLDALIPFGVGMIAAALFQIPLTIKYWNCFDDLSGGNGRTVACHETGCSILTEFDDGSREWVWIEKVKRASREEAPTPSEVVGSFEQCAYYLRQIHKYPDYGTYREAYRQMNCDEALRIPKMSRGRI